MRRDCIDLTWVDDKHISIFDKLPKIHLTKSLGIKIGSIITIINIIMLIMLMILSHNKAFASSVNNSKKKEEGFVKIFDNTGKEIFFDEGKVSAEYSTNSGCLKIKVDDKLYDIYNCQVIVKER